MTKVAVSRSAVCAAIIASAGCNPTPYREQRCAQACAEAANLGCFYQSDCEAVCRSLDTLYPVMCDESAQAYMDCASDERGTSYNCFHQYPIATACIAEFQTYSDCVAPCGDDDFDGVCGGYDCDDHDPLLGSKDYELCADGRDQDCDGVVDDYCEPGWTCLAISYGDGVCDCGCGIVDSDCASPAASACELCLNLGSCGSGTCPANIDPTDNSRCL